MLERGPDVTPLAHVRRITPQGDVVTLFDATADIAAIGSDTEDMYSKSIRGLAVVSPHRIALASGNGIVIRTVPRGAGRSEQLEQSSLQLHDPHGLLQEGDARLRNRGAAVPAHDQHG